MTITQLKEVCERLEAKGMGDQQATMYHPVYYMQERKANEKPVITTIEDFKHTSGFGQHNADAVVFVW